MACWGSLKIKRPAGEEYGGSGIYLRTNFWVPSSYINDSNFSKYLGHPKSKFQSALKNFREEIAAW